MTFFQLQICLLTTILACSAAPARSEEGKIAFTGAVTEPTCIVSNDRIIKAASLRSPSSLDSRTRFACDVTNKTMAITQYSVNIVSVAEARAGSNPLLDYFAGRLDSIGLSQARAKVITATYE